MSRIGKHPVVLPKGVTAKVEGNTVHVKGPKGELERTLHDDMKVTLSDGQILVERPSDESNHKALHGLSRTLVANMVDGVTKGFKKELELVGVGYKAEQRPYGLQMALGFSHPVKYEAPKGIKLSAPQPTQIVVEGANKEVVGQVAAEIRSIRPPEPYKGKGIKYVGEQIRRKAGKAGKAGGK
ncbi:MAG TPA: 50S ribosomal protein L6 [Gemmatimonadaceae bacterium]|jgi:large subunit ribosomal protein L6|nr:50S ribosomal protein L6 [Gemmatimonadaceae bacterium]